MPSKRPCQPKLRRIALGDLVARRDRANVISPRQRKALADSIAASGHYPPLIVRPHPRRAGKFEIIDGHHRAEVLRDLAEPTARCEVWPVDDGQAEVLAASLNRLRGRPDGRRHARRLRRLARRLGAEEAAARLGVTPQCLRQQIVAVRAVRPADAPPALDLHPVVFHLPKADAQALRRALDHLAVGALKRGQALLAAVRAAAKSQDVLRDSGACLRAPGEGDGPRASQSPRPARASASQMQRSK